MTVASAGIASSGMNDQLFLVPHLASSVLWARQLFHRGQAFIPVTSALHPNVFPTSFEGHCMQINLKCFLGFFCQKVRTIRVNDSCVSWHCPLWHEWSTYRLFLLFLEILNPVTWTRESELSLSLKNMLHGAVCACTGRGIKILQIKRNHTTTMVSVNFLISIYLKSQRKKQQNKQQHKHTHKDITILPAVRVNTEVGSTYSDSLHRRATVEPQTTEY